MYWNRPSLQAHLVLDKTEGRIYHVGWGLYNYELAGLHPSSDDLAKGLPDDGRPMAVLPNSISPEIEALFPYRCPADVAADSEWLICTRFEDAEADGPALR